MRMGFYSSRRFTTILTSLVVGVVITVSTTVNAAAADKKVEIIKPEKIEKIDKIVKTKGVDSSKAFVNRNGVVVNNVNFNPFFRPVDEFFLPNQFVEGDNPL
jgi:hypothetical protein